MSRFKQINRILEPTRTKAAIANAGAEILRQKREAEELAHLDQLAEIDEAARIVESIG